MEMKLNVSWVVCLLVTQVLGLSTAKADNVSYPEEKDRTFVELAQHLDLEKLKMVPHKVKWVDLSLDLMSGDDFVYSFSIPGTNSYSAEFLDESIAYFHRVLGRSKDSRCRYGYTLWSSLKKADSGIILDGTVVVANPKYLFFTCSRPY